VIVGMTTRNRLCRAAVAAVLVMVALLLPAGVAGAQDEPEPTTSTPPTSEPTPTTQAPPTTETPTTLAPTTVPPDPEPTVPPTVAPTVAPTVPPTFAPTTVPPPTTSAVPTDDSVVADDRTVVDAPGVLGPAPVTDDVDDDGLGGPWLSATARVRLAVAGLGGLAVLVSVLTLLYWRHTRPDLGLEVAREPGLGLVPPADPTDGVDG
jgi:hypothetical protein